ncbi:MAG: hypothetical protein IJ679_05035 [Lachnospiraceae bacterium]|nr:hypothetical protein [Lachnospiraceae bacterium]
MKNHPFTSVSFRRFLLRIFGFGLFCPLFVAGVSMGIDPYNVFHAASIRDNGVEAPKNYVKMKYILSHPDKFDSYVFGSSRVGAIFTKNMKGLHCYNMTYSMGLPTDHYRNLQTMIEHGIRPKKVFIGVDSLTYTMDPAIHKDYLYQYSYEMSKDDPLEFWKPYFDASMAFDSLSTTLAYKPKENYVSDFYQYGCFAFNYKRPKNLKYLKEGAFVGNADFRADVLLDIEKIGRLCEDNQIELVFFTNPMHHLTFEASIDQHWYDFVRELARRTDFVNFAGLNDVTEDDYNYNDTSHYVAQVGDLMIGRLLEGRDTQSEFGESFGFAVNKENVEELINVWEEERAK